MDRKTGLAGIVLALMPSCVYLPKETKEPEKDLTSEFVKPPVWYSLPKDEVRMEALAEFYFRSLRLSEQNENPNQNLVAVRIKRGGVVLSSGNGYMLDDCGLVLTSNHVAMGMDFNNWSFGSVVDMDGKEYPAVKTQLRSSLHDYAVLAVQTNKPRKSRPLKFATHSKFAPGEKLMYVSNPIGYLTGVGPKFPMQIAHGGGTIIDRKKAFEIILENMVEGDIDKFRDEVDKQLKFQVARGMFFSTSLVGRGNSGSPVFSSKLEFLGLVQGNYKIKGKTVPNVSSLTNSTHIIEGIRTFLRYP